MPPGVAALTSPALPQIQETAPPVQFNANTARRGGGGGLFSWLATTLNTVDFMDDSRLPRRGAYAGYPEITGSSVNGGQMSVTQALGGRLCARQ